MNSTRKGVQRLLPPYKSDEWPEDAADWRRLFRQRYCASDQDAAREFWELWLRDKSAYPPELTPDLLQEEVALELLERSLELSDISVMKDYVAIATTALGATAALALIKNSNAPPQNRANALYGWSVAVDTLSPTLETEVASVARGLKADGAVVPRWLSSIIDFHQ